MPRQYTSRQQDLFTFTLDGELFEAQGASMLDVAELAQYADADGDSPEGAAALATFFRGAMGDEYERFRAHVRKHRTSMDTLLQILQDMVLDMSGRPLPQSPPSQPGPTTTPTTSMVVSSSRDSVQFEELTSERAAELREAVGRATQEGPLSTP